MPVLRGYDDDGNAIFDREDGTTFTVPSTFVQPGDVQASPVGQPAPTTPPAPPLVGDGSLTPPEFQPQQIDPIKPIPLSPVDTTGMDPTSARYMQQAHQAFEDANQASAAATTSRANGDNEKFAQKEELQSSTADENQKAYDEHQKRIATLQARQEDILKRTQVWGSQQSDPEQFWAKKSTWYQLVAAIGAMGAGFTNPRGENPMLKYIDREIDMDVRAQEERLRRQGEGLRAERLDTDQQILQEREIMAQGEEHRVKGLQLAIQAVDSHAAQTTNEEAKARYMQDRAALEQKMAEAANKAAHLQISKENAQTAAYSRVESAKIGAVAGVGRTIIITAGQNKRNTENNETKLDIGGRNVGPEGLPPKGYGHVVDTLNGKQYLAPTGIVSHVAPGLTELAKANDTINQIVKLESEMTDADFVHYGNYGTDRYKKLKTLYSQLGGVVKNKAILELGANIAGKENLLYEGSVPDILGVTDKVTGNRNTAQLKQLQQNLHQYAELGAQTWGLTPAEDVKPRAPSAPPSTPKVPGVPQSKTSPQAPAPAPAPAPTPSQPASDEEEKKKRKKLDMKLEPLFGK